MSFGGTAKYDLDDPSVPDLVRAALGVARSSGFDLCVHPATGRLLSALAGGLPAGATIAETGTGTGAGLAWMAAAAHPGVKLVSAEIDPNRAQLARSVFAHVPNVEIITGPGTDLLQRAPFDLLVLDGGWGAGKRGDGYLDPAAWLTHDGVVTVDDFTPMTTWPPQFDGRTDDARVHWLTHPDLLATEIRVAPDMAVVVGRRRPAGP